MPEESKIEDPILEQEAIEEVKNELAENDANADGEDEEADEDDAPPDASNPDAVAASSATKKKKSKKRKLKNALTGKKEGEASASGLTGEQLQQVLEHNPSLKAEVSGMDEKKMQEMLKTLSVQDILSGMVRRIISPQFSLQHRMLTSAPVGYRRQEPQRHGELQVLVYTAGHALRRCQQTGGRGSYKTN